MGDAPSVSTVTMRILRDLMSVSTSARRRHVEHLLQALTRGLEQHRKARILGRDLQQPGRTLTLLPQRHPLTGAAARQQQRPARDFPEAGREQGRRGQVAHDGLANLVGVECQVCRIQHRCAAGTR